MRKVLFISLLAIGSTAHGQNNSRPRPFYEDRGMAVVNENTSRLGATPDYRECLVRKADRRGRRVCHTRAEWKRIAERLSKDDQQAR